ncbi:MAG: cytidylate kinase family protein [Candidatus Anstonellales archaeon]
MKICISGFAGSGKTTIAKKLSEKLKYPIINITFKDLAKEKNLTLEEVQKLAEKDKNIDLELDNLIIKKAKELDNCIISTWLGPWVIKDADLRIFLFAPIEERAKRIAERDKMSFEEALDHIKKRDNQNIKRYKKLYKIDIRNTDIFDLVINTSKLSIEQTADLVNTLAKIKLK